MCYCKPCRCSCDMRYLDTNYKYIGEHPPGTFTYSIGNSGEKVIAMRLPNYAVCILPIEKGNKDNWVWNGVVNKPTLSPALMHWGVEDGNQYEAWHGEIKEGVMQSCS
jgi:hypothetical protein